MTTFRAAYWISADRQASVRLTTEDQQYLEHDAMMAAARDEAQIAGLEIGDGKIVVGDWTE